MKVNDHVLVKCLNDKTVDTIELRKEENWSIIGGGTEDIRKHEKKLVAALEEKSG